MTTAQFAAKIKAKYPAYKNVPDDQLVQKVIAKYPVYKSQVDAGASQTSASAPQDPNNTITNDLGLGNIPGLSGIADFLTPSTNALPQAMNKMAQDSASQPSGQGNFGQSLQNSLQDAGGLAKTIAGPGLELGSYLAGGGEAKAGEQIASKLPGVAKKLIGSKAAEAASSVLPQVAKAIPRFGTGAMFQAGQQGSNPSSDILSGLLNTIMGPVANKVGDAMNMGALGKAGGKMGQIMDASGNPQKIVGGYNKLASQMYQYTKPIRDRINSIFDASGGLSRQELNDKVIHPALSGNNAFLSINKEVQDYLKKEFAPLVKSAGDEHFLNNMNNGKEANHLIDHNNPSGASGQTMADMAGVTTTGQGQGAKLVQKGTTAGQVVRPGTPGAKRVGPTNVFTKGSRAGNFVSKASPESATGTALAVDANTPWHAQPLFQASANTAKAWGNEAAAIPLHVWDMVRQNLGNDIPFKDLNNRAPTPVERFKQAVYGSLNDAMKSKMSKPDQQEFDKLRGLQQAATKIQQSAKKLGGGLSKGAAGIAIPALTAAHFVPGVGGALDALGGVGYLATRPAVSTGMSALAKSPIGSTLERILGSNLAGSLLGNQGQQSQ